MRQQLLEGDQIAMERISYVEAAALLNVSHTSISNWVKAGELERAAQNGYLIKASFDQFCTALVGRKKLNARANKQHAETHNHTELSAHIMGQVWERLADKNHGDQLAWHYEKTLSNTHKNKEGVYYTPPKICRDLMQKTALGKQTRFCDPCCGSGNFLLAALEAGVAPEHLAGYDTDPVAIEIARRRIFDRTGCKIKSLIVADFLCLADHTLYDVMMTNPPWGKKYARHQKRELARKFGLYQSLDSCSFFIAAILKSVESNGAIGLLLPESFFNISSFHEIRRRVLSRNVEHVIDYGKAFAGLLTKAHAVMLANSTAMSGNRVACLSGALSATRNQAAFSNNPFSIINFNILEAEAQVLDAMFNKPHTTLKHKARWGLGIVTGNNKKHLSAYPEKDLLPIFRGQDINKDEITQPSHYIRADFSRYQQVAPVDMYQAPAKIIYRFISSDLVFFYDEEQRFILNSANMLIIDESLLVETSKLVKYLNLDLINWWHKKLFNTHKILRSNLECIPIYLDYLENVRQPSNQSLLAYLNLEKMHGTYRAEKKNL